LQHGKLLELRLTSPTLGENLHALRSTGTNLLYEVQRRENHLQRRKTMTADVANKHLRVHGGGFDQNQFTWMCDLTFSTWFASSRATVHPPKPPPVMRHPYTPEHCKVSSTSSSSSVQLTS